MNDEDFEAQRQRILVFIERWPKTLGLGWWRMSYVYDRDGSAFEKAEIAGGIRSPTAARTVADWRYLEATITFNMPELVSEDDERLEYIFVHELMHVFLRENREGIDADHIRHDWLDHEERVATTLAHAFIWCRDEAKEVQA